VTLSPADLALAWYWTEPPDGWVDGHGDVARRVPLVVRDVITGQLLVQPVLAMCTEHARATPPTTRAHAWVFARAFYLHEALEHIRGSGACCRRGSRPSL
jgi:hypothetical protein